MTCDGCERENVALMDGHFCGQCSGQIAAQMQAAMDEVSVADGQVYDVFVGKDGRLHVRFDREGEDEEVDDAERE